MIQQEFKPSDMDALLAAFFNDREYMSTGRKYVPKNNRKQTRVRKTEEELKESRTRGGIRRNITKSYKVTKLNEILLKDHLTNMKLAYYLADEAGIARSNISDDGVIASYLNNTDNKDNCELIIRTKDNETVSFIAKWCNTPSFEIKQITPKKFAEEMDFVTDRQDIANRIMNEFKENRTIGVDEIDGIITRRDIKNILELNEGKAEFILFPTGTGRNQKLWIVNINECFNSVKREHNVKFSLMKNDNVISITYDLSKLIEQHDRSCECLSEHKLAEVVKTDYNRFF